MKVGDKEVAKNGTGVSESVESVCSGGTCVQRKVNVEKASDRSSRQEGVDLALLVLGSVWA